MQTIRCDNNVLNRSKREEREVCPYLWGSIFITWDGKIAFCEVDYIGDDLILTDFESVKKGADCWNGPRNQHARGLFNLKHPPTERIGIRCERCKFFPLDAGR
jgi:hypothetical protein